MTVPLSVGKRGTADVWDTIALADLGRREALRMAGEGAA
jgi:hypothetical protein